MFYFLGVFLFLFSIFGVVRMFFGVYTFVCRIFLFLDRFFVVFLLFVFFFGKF